MIRHKKLLFAAVGLDHRHIYDQVSSLIAAGGECVGWWTQDPSVQTVAGFVELFPQIPYVADRRRFLDDPAVHLITCAAIPCDRAAHSVEAMRAGKDFMVDKPGLTTFAQLDEVRRVQAETKRIFSVDFTERFEVKSTTRAAELVKAGAIGNVVHIVGLGPHRLNRHLRPQWFFDKKAYGGILVDIASHQFDQFLYFTGATDARIRSARATNVSHPNDPGLQDLGEVMIETEGSSGYLRVDWFTPDGLSTWGDGRLFLTGTEGSIEVRKYIDVEGRPGKDHLFLVDKKGMRYVDCSDAKLPYYDNLIADILERTETAMPQSHCFKVCELALQAQAMAEGV